MKQPNHSTRPDYVLAAISIPTINSLLNETPPMITTRVKSASIHLPEITTLPSLLTNAPGAPSVGGQPFVPPQELSNDGPASVAVAPVAPSASTEPQRATCPQCKKSVTTQVTYLNGLLTWVLCPVLLPWFCCLLFCFDYAKDAEHCCPSCDAVIGKASMWMNVAR